MDILFKNGIILTQTDPSVSEAILVRNGYIAAVGNLSDVEKQVETPVSIVDLNGKTLMPAFNDAHIHIWKVGDLLTFMLDLRGVRSLAEMQAKIADFALKNPQNAWILARGFNEMNFPDGQMPSRFDLDKVVSDRPCYVIRTCAHVAVLNSKALEICGIDDNTVVPNGGEIRRWEKSRGDSKSNVVKLTRWYNGACSVGLRWYNGACSVGLVNPHITTQRSKLHCYHRVKLTTLDSKSPRDLASNLTGVLSETALGLVQKHLPKVSHKALKTMVLAAQDALLKCGIAAATDPAVMPDLLAVYKEMDANNELKIRVNAVPIVVPDGATEALPLPELYESDFLKVNTVKFFADGGLSGKTAALKGFYKNTKEQGVLRLEYAFFKDLAAKAQGKGFKIATHAIGDAAIDMVLKVYKDISKDNHQRLQHRIEHLALPSKENLELMHDLGVHCVTQPIFLYELGPNFRQYLPPQYLDYVYPYRAVLDAKVNLAFSSDAPVVKDFNPLMGIQNAVERIDYQGFTIAESEKISVEEALYAYTMGAAKANDDDKIMGSLAVGKRADLVILDKNPITQNSKPDTQNPNTEGGKISEIQVVTIYVLGVSQKSR